MKNKQVVSTLLTVSMAASLLPAPAMALAQEQPMANEVQDTTSMQQDIAEGSKGKEIVKTTENPVLEDGETTSSETKTEEGQPQAEQEQSPLEDTSAETNTEEEQPQAEQEHPPLEDTSLETKTEEEQQQEQQEQTELVQEQPLMELLTEEMDLPDDTFSEYTNQKLEQMYLENLFYGNQKSSTFVSFFVNNHGDMLLQDDENALAIYRALKEKIKNVAESGGSTKFTDIQLKIPMPLEGGGFSSELKKSISSAITCLRVDIPEYIYWMDFASSYTMGAQTSGGKITSLTITLPVAKPYQKNNNPKEVNNLMEKAIQAKQNANKYAIEIRNTTYTNNVEKIRAIKDKVCELTAYNFKSDGVTPADPSATDNPWSDPWQMIWVFDNDTTNKVVCEGYSKAFQYLFDLIFAGDTSVKCYCVTGKMNNGGHMWNIVQMDGQNYLVDVTNCDNSYKSASSGGYSNNSGWFVNADGVEDHITGENQSDRVAGDGLFMLSTKGQLTKNGTYGQIVKVQGDVNTGYTIQSSTNSGGTLYTYDEETKSLHKHTEALDLTFVEKPSVSTEPQAVTNLTYDGQEHELVKAGTAANGKIQYRLGDTGEFSDTIPKAKNADTYQVYYKAVKNDVVTLAETFVEVTIAQADYKFDDNNSAITSISKTPKKGEAMPTTNTKAIATGVSNETVNGTLEWFTDANHKTPAKGNFDTAGNKTLYWKFTPEKNATNYKTDAKTGSVQFTVQDNTLPEYNGTVSAPTQKSKKGGHVALTPVTISGETIQYGYSNAENTTPNRWQNEAVFENVPTGEHWFFAKVTQTTTHKEKISTGTKITIFAKPNITKYTDIPTTLHVGQEVALKPTVSLNSAAGQDVKSYQVAQGTLPAGLVLDANTGNITGNLTTETTAQTVVKITVTDNEGTVSEAYTLQFPAIGKKGQTITAADVQATYGDVDKKINASSDDTNATLTYQVIEGTDVVAVDTDGTLSILKAGKAKVRITASATNTSGASTKDITVTIAKKQISDLTIILDKNRYPYDNGNEIRPVVTVTYNGGTDTLPDTEYVVSYHNNINVGEDTASVTVTEKTDGNYTFTSTSEKFSIEKINHDAISVSSVAKAGATGTIDLSQYLPDGANIALGVVTDTDTILDGTPVIAGNVLQYAFKPDVVEGKMAEISVNVTNCTNYNDFVIPVTITVTNKEPQKDFHFAETTVNKTYSDEDFVVTASGNAGTGAVTYESNATDVAMVEKTSGKVSIVKDGKVTITATSAADENYAEAKASYTLVIAKGTITITAKDKYLSRGGTLPTLTEDDYTITGLKAGETLKTLPQIQYEGNPDTTKEGTTPIQVSGAEKPEQTAGCYHDIVYKNGTLTIRRNNNSSGSSSSSSHKTETTTTSDGTKVEVITKPDGTKVETTKTPDGMVSVIETKKDGTVIKTETTKDGDKVEEVKKPDGSSITDVKKADGTTATTTIDKNGQTKAEVKISDKAINEANKENKPISIPVTPVQATNDSETAPVIKVETESTKKIGITIPVKNPTEGTVAVIVHANGIEEIIRKSVADKNGVTMHLENGATVKIIEHTKTFVDTQTHWAENAINFVTSHELYFGTSENTFSPDTAMTRGMLAVVLHNLESNPTTSQKLKFKDVKADAWYTNAVQWAAEQNIVSGYKNGNFGPNDTITREQLAVMLYRYVGSPTHRQNELHFADANHVSTYAKEAMRWAVEEGIISGTDNNMLNPKKNATRAEVAAMLMRLMHTTI